MTLQVEEGKDYSRALGVHLRGRELAQHAEALGSIPSTGHGGKASPLLLSSLVLHPSAEAPARDALQNDD